MKLIKLSLIITCHNQEIFLRQLIYCLDKYLSFEKKIEIIIIDSSDYDFYISDKYFIHKIENLGPSFARNFGAKISSGEWLVFCDADDIINPRMINYLINEDSILNYDAIFFKYKRVYDEHIINEFEEIMNHDGLPNLNEFKLIKGPQFFFANFFPLHAVAIKSYVFKEVKFNESQWFIEDTRFYIEMAILKTNTLRVNNNNNFISFHRDFRIKQSLSNSSSYKFWEGIMLNYDFVSSNFKFSLTSKIQIIYLFLSCYQFLPNDLKSNKLVKNINIWNYFFGLPVIFRNDFLFSLCKKILRYIKY